MAKIERIFLQSGMRGISIEHESGFGATVTPYGAQVISWRAPDKRELLFLSERATFAAGKAIRGGIPIVFPQFGKGTLPSHGFARITEWEVVRADAENGAAVLHFRLASSDVWRKEWPHSFTADLEIELTDALKTRLCVRNSGESSFQYQDAFHTYFAVGDIDSCRIGSLQGCNGVDFLAGRAEFSEERDAIQISAATDRVYMNSPRIVKIDDPSTRTTFVIEKEGLSDSVVWNPWQEGAVALGDLDPSDYKRMVCVESGNVGRPIEIAPGAEHVSTQSLRIS